MDRNARWLVGLLGLLAVCRPRHLRSHIHFRQLFNSSTDVLLRMRKSQLSVHGGLRPVVLLPLLFVFEASAEGMVSGDRDE